jgi:hypothetical protein
MDDEVEAFLRADETCFDRFTFDKIFRFLLKNDFEHEDARDIILHNCALSALVLQERILNCYYQKIKSDEKISADLCELKRKCFERILKEQGTLN